SVDPLASKYPGWSPYNYTKCNPLRFIDPNGMEQGEPGQNGDEGDESDEKSSWWDKFKKFLNTLVYSKYQEKTEEKDMSPTDNIKPVKTLNDAQKVGQQLAANVKNNSVTALDASHTVLSRTSILTATGAKITIGFPPLSGGLATISTVTGEMALGTSMIKFAITGDNQDYRTMLWDGIGVTTGRMINTALAPSTTITVDQSSLLRNVFGSSNTIINYGVGSGFGF
ncbi:MAG: hypothetical protein HF312_21250, partial [Ignavibacteria bacterium]|nr:hypothetical protein [Ignavibacteria bacterium]